jgi:nucleotide-binding universal stress UspA family protein
MQTTRAPDATTTRRGTPKRLLLAVDGSAPSIRAAAVAASLIEPGATVELLTVLSYDRYPHSFGYGDLSDADERAAAATRAIERAQADARGMLEAAGATVVRAHRYGLAPEEIADEIATWQPDLVVIGRRGLSGPGRWLGSVSDRVIHAAKVPVLVVP